MKAKQHLLFWILFIPLWLFALKDFVNLTFEIAFCNYPKDPFLFYWLIYLGMIFFFPIISALNCFIFLKENKKIKPEVWVSKDTKIERIKQ